MLEASANQVGNTVDLEIIPTYEQSESEGALRTYYVESCQKKRRGQLYGCIWSSHRVACTVLLLLILLHLHRNCEPSDDFKKYMKTCKKRFEAIEVREMSSSLLRFLEKLVLSKTWLAGIWHYNWKQNMLIKELSNEWFNELLYCTGYRLLTPTSITSRGSYNIKAAEKLTTLSPTLSRP